MQLCCISRALVQSPSQSLMRGHYAYAAYTQLQALPASYTAIMPTQRIRSYRPFLRHTRPLCLHSVHDATLRLWAHRHDGGALCALITHPLRIRSYRPACAFHVLPCATGGYYAYWRIYARIHEKGLFMLRSRISCNTKGFALCKRQKALNSYLDPKKRVFWRL